MEGTCLVHIISFNFTLHLHGCCWSQEQERNSHVKTLFMNTQEIIMSYLLTGDPKCITGEKVAILGLGDRLSPDHL